MRLSCPQIMPSGRFYRESPDPYQQAVSGFLGILLFRGKSRNMDCRILLRKTASQVAQQVVVRMGRGACATQLCQDLKRAAQGRRSLQRCRVLGNNMWE